MSDALSQNGHTLSLGEFNKDESILTRINSSVVDNDVTKILSGTNEKKYDKIFEKMQDKHNDDTMY